MYVCMFKVLTCTVYWIHKTTFVMLEQMLMVYRLIAENTLWDGHGYTVSSTCYTCEFNNPPWFCKQLPKPTTEDIEIRICMWLRSRQFLT